MTKKLEYITNNYELAENLRNIREDRDLRQHEVANAINCARSTYAYYEMGKTLPNIYTLIELAKFYNIDIRCFVYRFGENKINQQRTT